MDADEHLQTVQRATDRLREAASSMRPRLGVILGSGLGSALPALEEVRSLGYEEVPGFSATTVPGHAGRLILGRLPHAGAGVVVLQGRIHYFEGRSLAEVTLPVRVLAGLGARTLIAVSAVGSMRPALKPGHLVVLKDHINLMGHNPLRGAHTEPFGPMFPDMTSAYAPSLRKAALAACRRLKIPAREGVYVAVGGPSYETPAEIRAFSRLGGDVVGMSTVPEVIAARQRGLDVLALGHVSNMAAGIGKIPLAHEEVLELGRRMSVRLKALLEDLLPRL